MQVVTIAYARDNYGYVVTPHKGKGAVVIDPGQAQPFLEVLESLGREPEAVLCTHHHADHVAGVGELVQRYPRTRVLAHQLDAKRIADAEPLVFAQTQPCNLKSIEVIALHVPGHTMGSVAWYIEDCVFTGDTLFGAGCGRLFEGTAEQMYHSLNHVLRCLPDSTRVYGGHNYTLDNLRFAQTIEPNNKAIEKERERVEALLARGEPSMPSSIGRECLFNPFLRCDQRQLIDSVEKHGVKDNSKDNVKDNSKDTALTTGTAPSMVFAHLRKLKDRFQT